MVKEFEVHPYTEHVTGRPQSYNRFLEQEGLPVYSGMFMPDVASAKLKAWKRKGGRGAFLRFSDQNLTDGYVCEIPPRGTLKPQRHVYEELILIVSGRGGTTAWNESGPKHTFEWEAGSLFSVPLNAWHQHFNGSEEPVRYFAVTTAPMLMDFFNDWDFIFHNAFVFRHRFAGEADYFRHPGRHLTQVYGGLLETNFIPDIRRIDLVPREKRGPGVRNMYIELAGSSMAAHVSKFPVGSYKKAHRHGPGAHVYILGSRGYTLMWREGEPRQRFDWQTDSVLSPPAGWYHQHFNTGREPAMFVAFHPSHAVWENPRVDDTGQQIEYEDEDPAIRTEYEAELARAGIPVAMPPIPHAR